MHSMSCDVITLADRNAHTDTCMDTPAHTWTQSQTRSHTHTHTHTQKLSATHPDIVRRNKRQQTITITRSSLAHQHKYKHTYTHSSGCVTCPLHHHQTSSPTSVQHCLSFTLTTLTHCCHLCHLMYQRVAWTRQVCHRITA